MAKNEMDKTKIQYLLKHESSGRYYGRLSVNGKQVWKEGILARRARRTLRLKWAIGAAYVNHKAGLFQPLPLTTDTDYWQLAELQRPIGACPHAGTIY